MDPLTAALCGLGAMVILSGNASSPAAPLALFLGFYGVHRALRTGASKVLIAFPAAIWFFANLLSFMPQAIVDRIGPSSTFLGRAPENITNMLLIVALLIMVASARARLGGALATVTLVALGIDLFFRLVPSMRFQDEESFSVLVLSTEGGYGIVAHVLGALCMFLVGVGPIAVAPLPRRGGAIAGAIGALLLAALIVGLPRRIAPNESAVLAVFALLWVVANVLSTIGLGAMAKAGAKVGGWIGIALGLFGLFGLFGALAIFDKVEENAYGFTMSTPFGLLGIGIALLAWKGAPLVTARNVLGIAFIAAFVGGTLAWMSTYLALAHITNPRTPWALARLTTEPIAIYGLILWAALLLYLASPPGPLNRHGERLE